MYGWLRFIGKMVLCRVSNIARKKPQGQQLDEANPERSDDTGLWVCPFCKKDDFAEISEVSARIHRNTFLYHCRVDWQVKYKSIKFHRVLVTQYSTLKLTTFLPLNMCRALVFETRSSFTIASTFNMNWQNYV